MKRVLISLKIKNKYDVNKVKNEANKLINDVTKVKTDFTTLALKIKFVLYPMKSFICKMVADQ